MRGRLRIAVLSGLLVPALLLAAGAAEESSADRGKYLVEKGEFIPPEEIHEDSYISSVDMEYPQPPEDFGVTFVSGHRQIAAGGAGGNLPSLNITPPKAASTFGATHLYASRTRANGRTSHYEKSRALFRSIEMVRAVFQAPRVQVGITDKTLSFHDHALLDLFTEHAT